MRGTSGAEKGPRDHDEMRGQGQPPKLPPTTDCNLVNPAFAHEIVGEKKRNAAPAAGIVVELPVVQRRQYNTT